MFYWFKTLQYHLWKHHKTHDKIKVLEIGVYHADNTRKLLETYPKMQLTSIDPAGHENISQLLEEYPTRFNYVQYYSIPFLENNENEFDVVLIDGDHNRYTVYNELRLIFERFEKFPLIILHDTNHPWGRQDYSYQPSTIPMGELGGIRQGVLTGVEDFIHDFTDEEMLRYFRLTLYQMGPGLGVLELLNGGF